MEKQAIDADIAAAKHTIKLLQDRVQLVDFALRLKKDYPEISFMAYDCLDKCLKKKLVNRNINRLPPPSAIDKERVDIELIWKRAVAACNVLSIATLNSVRRHGYRNAMLNQLSDISSIGTGGFQRLLKFSFPEFSAEYVMRKYYSDLLSAAQIARIDQILLDAGVEIDG